MQAPCGTRPAGRWNRNGLVVGTFFTKAIGTAEREAAIAMIEGLPDDGRITLSSDKGYDTQDFVAEMHRLGVIPHVTPSNKKRRSAIDGRTTRHAGYAVSLYVRVMRTYDFTPLFRSAVGFDRLFDMIESSVRPDWPPYNIEKNGENQYRISMAIAGSAPNEIELIQQGNTLLVTGQKKTEPKHQEMLHQGLASRSFKQTFNLADHVKVASADLENGLLVVELVREVPEQLKPRRIELGSHAAALTAQDNQQRLTQGSVAERQAA